MTRTEINTLLLGAKAQKQRLQQESLHNTALIHDLEHTFTVGDYVEAGPFEGTVEEVLPKDRLHIRTNAGEAVIISRWAAALLH